MSNATTRMPEPFPVATIESTIVVFIVANHMQRPVGTGSGGQPVFDWSGGDICAWL